MHRMDKTTFDQKIYFDTPFLIEEFNGINIYDSITNQRQDSWDHFQVLRLVWYYYERTIPLRHPPCHQEQILMVKLKHLFEQGLVPDIAKFIRDIQDKKYLKALENVMEMMVSGIFFLNVNVLDNYQEMANGVMKTYDFLAYTKEHLYSLYTDLYRKSQTTYLEFNNDNNNNTAAGLYTLLNGRPADFTLQKFNPSILAARLVKHLQIDQSNQELKLLTPLFNSFSYRSNPNKKAAALYALIPNHLSHSLLSLVGAKKSGIVRLFCQLHETPSEVFRIITKTKPGFLRDALESDPMVNPQILQSSEAWIDTLVMTLRWYSNETKDFTLLTLAHRAITLNSSNGNLSTLFENSAQNITPLTLPGWFALAHASHILTNYCRNVVSCLDKCNNDIYLPYTPNEHFSTAVGIDSYRKDLYIKAYYDAQKRKLSNMKGCEGRRLQARRADISKYKWCAISQDIFQQIASRKRKLQKTRLPDICQNCPDCQLMYPSKLVGIGFKNTEMKALTQLLACGLLNGIYNKDLYHQNVSKIDPIIHEAFLEGFNSRQDAHHNSQPILQNHHQNNQYCQQNMTDHMANKSIRMVNAANHLLKSGRPESVHEHSGNRFRNLTGDAYALYCRDQLQWMNRNSALRTQLKIALEHRICGGGPNAKFSDLHAQNFNDLGNKGMIVLPSQKDSQYGHTLCCIHNTNKVYIANDISSFITRDTKSVKKTLSTGFHRNDKGGNISHYANRINASSIQRTNTNRGDMFKVLYSESEFKLHRFLNAPFDFTEYLRISPGFQNISVNYCIDNHGVTNLPNIPFKLIQSELGYKASNFPAISMKQKVKIETSTSLPLKEILITGDEHNYAMLPSNFHKCGVTQFSKATDPHSLRPLVIASINNIDKLAEIDHFLRRVEICSEKTNRELLTFHISRVLELLWIVLSTIHQKKHTSQPPLSIDQNYANLLANLANDMCTAIQSHDSLLFSKSSLASAGKQCTYIALGEKQLANLEKSPKTRGAWNTENIPVSILQSKSLKKKKENHQELSSIQLCGDSLYYRSRKGSFLTSLSCGGMEYKKGQAHLDTLKFCNVLHKHWTHLNIGSQKPETMKLIEDAVLYYNQQQQQQQIL